MKAFVQRVSGHTEIVCRLGLEGDSLNHHFKGPGLVVLLGWLQSDVPEKLDHTEGWIFSRVEGLRVFPDSAGRMNLNLQDYLSESKTPGGGILWVPQFTLAAKLESGFRPSFTAAMAPELARARFDRFVERISQEKRPYRNIFGVFGADMDLSFTNWGPVTIPLEI